MQPKLWILAFAAAFGLSACADGGGTFGGPGVGLDPSNDEDISDGGNEQDGGDGGIP